MIAPSTIDNNTVNYFTLISSSGSTFLESKFFDIIIAMSLKSKDDFRSLPIQKLNQRKKTPWSNLAIGAAMNVFQVSSLGQPMEVIKTYVWTVVLAQLTLITILQVAANRNATLAEAVRVTWSRGGYKAFYQGLIPWVHLA